MTIHETRTELDAEEVLARAEVLFTTLFSPYASFVTDRSADHIRLRSEVAEVVIGALQRDGHTLVRGSASRGEDVLARFLCEISNPDAAREEQHRYRRRQ
jgi:hypothetical protein